MGPCDLSRHQLIVVGDVRLGIMRTVLEFDRQSKPELIEIELNARPVDSDRLADPASLCAREGALRNDARC
jgi:hypothetical protein